VYDEVPFMLLNSLEAIDASRIARLIEYVEEYSDYLVVALLLKTPRRSPENTSELPGSNPRCPHPCRDPHSPATVYHVEERNRKTPWCDYVSYAIAGFNLFLRGVWYYPILRTLRPF